MDLLLAVIFLLLSCANLKEIKDHRGKEFLIAFPQQYYSSGSLDIYIACTETSQVNVTAAGYKKELLIEPNNVTHLVLPNRLLMDLGREENGVLISSDREIAVYGLNQVHRTTDAYLALPTDILGYEYLAVGSDRTSNLGSTYKNILSIVAVHDNTTVTINSGVELEIGRARFHRGIFHPPGRPLVVTLNRMETYTVRSVDDITGSLVIYFSCNSGNHSFTVTTSV